MEFKQFDVVEVIGFNAKSEFRPDDCNKREPRIGDIATILEVYSEPDGYELECSDSNGITEWLGGFSPDEIKLALAPTRNSGRTAGGTKRTK
jgi:hypothetical protein